MSELSNDELYPDEHLCKELDERIKGINGILKELCIRENIDVLIRVQEASGMDFKKYFRVTAEVNRIENLL